MANMRLPFKTKVDMDVLVIRADGTREHIGTFPAEMEMQRSITQRIRHRVKQWRKRWLKS